MKKIYLVGYEGYGEYEFFFDSKGKLLHHWHRNDASWRSEYMNPLLKKLGYEVVDGDYNDKRFKGKITDVLVGDGAPEDILNEEIA